MRLLVFIISVLMKCDPSSFEGQFTQKLLNIQSKFKYITCPHKFKPLWLSF